MADAAFLRVPSCADGAGGPLRSVLDGHLRCEQLTARRRLLTSLLALLSAPVWALALWPQLFAGPDRRFLLCLFGFLLVSSAWAALEEWRAFGRLRRTLAETARGGEVAGGPGPAERL